MRASAPENEWSVTDYLLAQAVDCLAVIAWQNSKDGADNTNYPEPIKRPFEQDPQKEEVFSLDVENLKQFLNQKWKAV